jgi:carboxylesterase
VTRTVLPGAEPFELGDGPTGVVVIHGFTGTPQAVKPLAERLARRQMRVVAPLLPGHGTRWEELNRAGAADWRAAVEDAYDRAVAGRDEVFMVGLSFGGTLALDFAARHPGRVAGVVTLAGLVHTRDLRRFIAPLLKYLVRSVPGISNDIADNSVRELAYDRLPAAGAHQMLKVVKETRRALPMVECPLLVVHSPRDHTVGVHNAKVIRKRVSSKEVRVEYLEHSYHVLTLDRERERVNELTYGFIKEHSRHAV